ncbi:MAG: hypothetical protein CO030_00595 [Candidatus Magasanikbacteria bacterium CG_4_9_14_0_2_um_filter_42_11]|uniref:Uncharacterized protein n=1 Tax=Candidatus Magasanikbacteria bacterium CG_4_9_14_0_2_um_filter_42_11 TaxID=1974643 RepID=A0A2M8FAW0_9BACT|nr:MAG: hypothetical protein COU34_01830 [Candidatus Magasanikbacteria bacterium CG10_big_fil_rev_8_21_14_0_10_43_9]PIY92368.1 MAG: hypothetical protein COY70_03680 [Candidatus Magasanikbacteria bacterium CG_4_10_14_0_8_um_filter_42_12]PJC52873.1 MAG: hypothetical protein CO030_00595 [Candidatus Magasanikbacteria bacterium CG_4_9_14_0_2_um_filter_42_11]
MFDRHEVFEMYREERLWGLQLAEEGDIRPLAEFFVVKFDVRGLIIRQPKQLRFGPSPEGSDGELLVMDTTKVVRDEFLGQSRTASCLFLVPEDGVSHDEVRAHLDGVFQLQPLNIVDENVC